MAGAVLARVGTFNPAAGGGNIWPDPDFANPSLYNSVLGTGTWSVSGGAMHFSGVDGMVVRMDNYAFTECVNGATYRFTITVANFVSCDSFGQAGIGGGARVNWPSITGNGEFHVDVVSDGNVDAAVPLTYVSMANVTLDLTHITVVRQ